MSKAPSVTSKDLTATSVRDLYNQYPTSGKEEVKAFEKSLHDANVALGLYKNDERGNSVLTSEAKFLADRIAAPGTAVSRKTALAQYTMFGKESPVAANPSSLQAGSPPPSSTVSFNRP